MVAFALMLPAASSAAVNCTYTMATNTAAVTLDATNDIASVSRDLGGAILVGPSFPGAPCQTATVSTTDTITITDTSGSNVFVFINLINGGFAPGADNEGGSPSAEIEFQVDLGNGLDRLFVDGAGAVSNFIRSGTGGINLNADETTDVDADITNPTPATSFPAGVDSLSPSGGGMGDNLSAEGGAGTGAVSAIPHFFDGNMGNDTFVGGDGDDSFVGNEDNDSFTGGGGTDFIDYQSADGPISVNLSLTGPQSIGADQGTDTIDSTIEVLLGGNFGDTLTGRAGSNTIQALQGDDIIFDRDGAADVLDCSDGQDTVTTDAAGVDSLLGCETQLFPALPVPATPVTPAATPSATPNPACAPLRAKLKKAKTKKRRRALRAKLRQLGC